MLTALQNGKVVFARDAKKPGEFVCPECGELVTLRKGRIKIHHFAHKPPVVCSYGRGETLAHQEAKLELYDVLMADPTVSNVEIEKSFGTVRADVYAVIDETPVVFEIQCSTLDFDTLTKRTKAYTAKGISLCWLLLPRDDIYGERIIPKAWEKWLHAANLGEIYFWQGDGFVTPVKFEKYYIDVPYTDFGGGYSYISKRFKTPARGNKSHVVRDFARERLKAWSAYYYEIPLRWVWRRI
ncbi:competence protein CoiA [Providencia alcalifaciens]|uniref:competence protein CoiA n=1 Tax=Providencia alcalifaciens TaxID=126385 RepID=UPI0012B5B39B|nr:competence protein CoiA family protein [Providencia alcalifaciens]MTC16844.1 competence protein CoiA [Providencia alcalifaciens]